MKSAGKMTTVFRDARNIIHIDYLPSKQTINGDYYAVLLDRFNNILKKKRPHLEEKSASIETMHGFTRARHRHGQIQRIPLRIASPSSILARLSPLRLFPVSKPEEMV